MKIKMFDQFLNEGKNNTPIKKGDSVIENPKKPGFGFEGKIGIVKSVDDTKDFKCYVVKFGKEEQEYHDDEIVLAPKK